MAECYRCGKEIDVVVFCPFCGAKQRSSLELYKENKEKDAKVTVEEAPIKKDIEITDVNMDKAPVTAQVTPPSVASKPAETPKSFKIGKEFALWIIFIIVFFAFIYAVIMFWQDIMKMP